MYTPPFIITNRIVELISQISERVGQISALPNSPDKLRLRKQNRIKTIHSSLAIENSSLSLDQITAIINGKHVLGNPNEIREVTNSIEAYDLLLSLNPYSEADLLKAHGLMMRDLVSRSGIYRTGGVGIFNGARVVHVAPPASNVPSLMADLFTWLQESDIHPLIKSCVFHYEFEFIHPFADGNGRMGRMWQTVILKHWREVFAWLPVETLIKEHQTEYYHALGVSDQRADSTCFTEFMLALILRTIDDIIETEKKVTVKVTVNQQKILDAIADNPYMTLDELASAVGISRKSIAENIKKLQAAGRIKRVGADRNGYWLVAEE